MDEIEEIHRILMKRIDEARLSGAKEYRRELRTCRAAVKALKELMVTMRLSA